MRDSSVGPASACAGFSSVTAIWHKSLSALVWGMAGWHLVVVLHKAEFVPFWVLHDHDDPLVVVVPLA